MSDLLKRFVVCLGALCMLSLGAAAMAEETVLQTVQPVTTETAPKVAPKIPAPVAITDLKVHGFIQAYYAWYEKMNPDSYFEIKRARMTLEGVIARAVKSKIQVDMASATNVLLDAYISYKPFSYLNLKMGQVKIPFSEEQIGSSAKLAVFHRSEATSKLSYNYDLGLMADGKLLGNKIYYGAGVFNGTGRNQADNNDNKDVVGRVVLTPMAGSGSFLDGLSLGGAVQVGRQPQAGTDEGERTRYGGLLKYAYAGFTLQGEYIYQEKEQVDASKNFASGWYGLATYCVVPELDVAVKFEMYDPDQAVELDGSQVGSIGLNYFFNKMKVQATYRLKKSETDINPIKEFYLMTQIKYGKK
ncbi:OprO/OprP family phosphate-selective porin [bacterium]|nr:OprO/OprP family phosphate-selective porin [bacterium]